MAFIYDLSDTWNNAGISWNGVKLNVTDTASAVGSKLLDLQIGGASKFTVGKTGSVIATGNIHSTSGGFTFPDGTTQTTKATVNSVSGTGTVNGITLTGTITNTGSLTLGGTLGNIANSQLTNSAITINGTSTPLGGSIAVGTVTSVGGTGTVSGLSLTGSVTTSGSLTLGGTLVLTSGQVTDALGYTPYNATNPAGYTTNVGTVTSVAGTGTVNGLTLTGTVTTSGSLTLGGTLGNIANSQLTNSAITINGTSTALGGSISVGTVTSVAALTLGTSGTDLASSVANGTTTPVITLNVPTASASNRGALSSSDWSTFNAKQAALVSGTNIKTVGGASLLGSGDVGTIGLAYGGTGATTASGARTALGLGTAAVLNAGVSGGVATLDGSGTVPTSQLPGAVLGGLNYQGTWNASTNTPTLASSTGSKGYYYVVSVAGSTNLNGITDWKIGDWAVYDGTTWQKVDNTDAVSSVNGYTGAVVLTTSDVAQGTNLYFTQAAARGSVSAGTGISYDSGTGVITNSAPDQTVALTGAGTTVVTGTYPNFTITSNDSTVGTVTSVGGTGTVSGLTLTGTVTTSGNLTLGGTLAVTPSNFASQTANTVLAAPNGAAGVPTFRAIVAADIPTLNQNTTGTASNVTGTVAVGNGGTGATTLSSGYVLKGNGTSAVSASVVYDNGTNVGIGTTTPGIKLEVSGGIGDVINGNSQVFARSGDNTNFNQVRIRATATESRLESLAVGTGTSSPLVFHTGGSERMRITSAGNVGIGVTPSAWDSFKVLQVGYGAIAAPAFSNTIVTANAYYASGSFRYIASSSPASVFQQADGVFSWKTAPSGTAGNAISFSERMRIDSSGNVGIGTTPSAWSGVTALQMANGSAIAGNNQYLEIDTNAYYNAGYKYIGTGLAAKYSQQAGVHVWFNAASGTAGATTSFAERMRIDASGNVGIGTSSPDAKLDILGASGDQIRLRTAETEEYRIGRSTSTGYLDFYGSQTGYTGYTFGGVNGERMRIDASGNVGIGTSSPSALLDVFSAAGPIIKNRSSTVNTTLRGFEIQTVNDVHASFKAEASSGELRIASGFSTWGGYQTFYTNGAERMRIDSSGNVGIGTSSPGGSYGKLTVAGGIRTVEDTSSKLEIGRFSAGAPNSYIKLSPNSASLRFTNAADDTDLMTLTNAGNLGIGTTTAPGPNGKGIAVYASDYPRLTLRNATTGDGTGDGSGLMVINSDFYVFNNEAANVIFSTNGGERARIDSSGNLLVGTTSVLGKITLQGDVNGNIDTWIRNDNSGSSARAGIVLNAFGNSWRMGVGSSANNGNALTWNVDIGGANTERMRIDTSGNLLVGTTSSASLSGDCFLYSPVSSNIALCHSTSISSGTNYIGFLYNGSTIGSITQSGTTAVAYNTSSDVRLKDNIADADNASSLIDALQVRKFDWKADGSHQRYGFVAQELVTVAPEAVSQPADPDDMMGVDYSKLVPMLVKEIQSLRARVAQLEGN